MSLTGKRTLFEPPERANQRPSSCPLSRHPGEIYSERFATLDAPTRTRIDWTPALSVRPDGSVEVNEEELKKQASDCPVARGLVSRFCASARATLELPEYANVADENVPGGAPGAAVEAEESCQSIDQEVSSITAAGRFGHAFGRSPLGDAKSSPNLAAVEPDIVAAPRTRDCGAGASASSPEPAPAECSSPKRRRTTPGLPFDTPPENSSRFCRRVKTLKIPAGLLPGDCIRLYDTTTNAFVHDTITVPVGAHASSSCDFEDPPDTVAFLFANGAAPASYKVRGNKADQHAVRLHVHKQSCSDPRCRVLGCRRIKCKFEFEVDISGGEMRDFEREYMKTQRRNLKNARARLSM